MYSREFFENECTLVGEAGRLSVYKNNEPTLNNYNVLVWTEFHVLTKTLSSDYPTVLRERNIR